MSKYFKINLIRVFLALFVIVSIFGANISIAKAGYSASELVSMTNATRSKEGLGTLSVDSRLTAAAAAKAKDMIDNDYFAHTSPSGKTPWDFIHAAGYNYTYAGENLAIGYSDAATLFNAWMNSATHRENIVNPNYKNIGIAVLQGEYQGGTTIVVAQEFGTLIGEEAQSAPQVASEAQAPTEAAPTLDNNETVMTENNRNETQEQNNAPAASEVSTNESYFNPKTVYAGDEVEFQLVVRGEFSNVKLQIGKSEIALTDPKDSENGKVFVKKEKFNTAGDFDVIAILTSKSGERKTQNLGKLKVNNKVIANTSSENQISSKNVNNVNWPLIAVSGSTIAIAVIGFAIFRKYRFVRKISHSLSSWNI